MIGSLVVRCAHFVVAIGAEDLEVREGAPSRWSIAIALAGDGMRIRQLATLDDRELPALARELEALQEGRRSAAHLVSKDGTLRLTFARGPEKDFIVAVWIRRDAATGLYSTAESHVSPSALDDVARRASRFPYA